MSRLQYGAVVSEPLTHPHIGVPRDMHHLADIGNAIRVQRTLVTTSVMVNSP